MARVLTLGQERRSDGRAVILVEIVLNESEDEG